MVLKSALESSSLLIDSGGGVDTSLLLRMSGSAWPVLGRSNSRTVKGRWCHIYRGARSTPAEHTQAFFSASCRL
eukprot:COSAG01_NODE_841_length_13175_cov_26.426124_1_plen_74_part_00